MLNLICGAFLRPVLAALLVFRGMWYGLILRLLFSLKPKEMAKITLLAIWIDQR